MYEFEWIGMPLLLMVTPVVKAEPMVVAGITVVWVTPACIRVRPTRFRPLSGRSETCCSFTTPPSVLLEVWTRGTSSATVTVWAGEPTSKMRSIVASCATSSVIPVRVSAENPSLVTSTR